MTEMKTPAEYAKDAQLALYDSTIRTRSREEHTRDVARAQVHATLALAAATDVSLRLASTQEAFTVAMADLRAFHTALEAIQEEMRPWGTGQIQGDDVEGLNEALNTIRARTARVRSVLAEAGFPVRTEETA